LKKQAAVWDEYCLQALNISNFGFWYAMVDLGAPIRLKSLGTASSLDNQIPIPLHHDEGSHRGT
jgi:hypothetical protein